MKKRMLSLLSLIVLFTLSCQFLSRGDVGGGTVISNCADVVSAVRTVQPGSAPQALLETGVKQGGEFDANEYFNVLPHISMQDGYSLDYVYQVDSLGAFPILFALPDDQAPYASMNDIPANTDLPEYADHLDIEDVEQGYFEMVVLRIMAGQFYLDWHANYNDTDIVCNRGDVRDIISDVNAGDFGMKFDLSQQAQARTMKDIEPRVIFNGDTAVVQVVTFTKWGGFYRETYTISRAFPHTIIDVKDENLVPYDCGVMF
jgi:hypothetical protein